MVKGFNEAMGIGPPLFCILALRRPRSLPLTSAAVPMAELCLPPGNGEVSGMAFTGILARPYANYDIYFLNYKQ